MFPTLPTRSPRSRGLLAAIPALLGAALALGAAPATATIRPALAPGCDGGVDDEALRALRDRIASAPSLAAARSLATRDSGLARAVLGRAKWLAPRAAGLEAAHERLTAYEEEVAAARSPEQVAAEFGKLVQLASLAPGGVYADVGFGGGCDYSTGEIIAIVLGFILGIIPGIILLILLC